MELIALLKLGDYHNNAPNIIWGVICSVDVNVSTSIMYNIL